jgi:hypothetical protein
MQLGLSPSCVDAFALTGLIEPSGVTMAFASASRPCARNHGDRCTIRCAMPNTIRAWLPVVAPHTTDAPGSYSFST